MSVQHDHGTGSPGGAILLLVVAGGAAAGATQTSQTGPVLAFVGALLVVVITAVTTNRRQSQQLSAEADRHRETLNAEAERLDSQLAHDRKLANIQHLRELLDVMAAAYEAVASTGTSLLSVLSTWAEDEEGGVGRRREAYDAANTSRLAMATELHRLEMRFEGDDPVFIEFNAATDAFNERHEVLKRAWIDSVQLDQNGEGWRQAVDNGADAAQAFRRFAAAARVEIGVREAEV
jgi:hypothetical protein